MKSQKSKIFNFLVSLLAVLLTTPFILDHQVTGFLQKITWFMYLFLWLSMGISLKDMLNIQIIKMKTMLFYALYGLSFALPFGLFLTVVMRNDENQMNIMPFMLWMVLSVLSVAPFIVLTRHFKKNNIRL